MRVLMLLLGSLVSTAAMAAPDGVAALRAFYERVDSLSATFDQVQRDSSGAVIQKASGIFLLSRPDRFRWAYREPYEQIIVSNGEAFRFYDVDLAQVTIRDVNESLRATPAQLLAGGASLQEAFEVSDAGKRDGLTWVQLIPRDDNSDFKAIRMGLDDNVPAAMELDDQLGQTTRITFSDIEVNPSLTAKRFELDIPEEVTVVDGRKNAQ